MRCIKSMNFKNLFATVNEIHGITGKNRPFLFCDVVWCGLRYGAGYRDYRLNEWWTLNGKQRKTYVTRGINNSIIKKCNDPAYYHLLNNKIDFNRLFGEYLGRRWIYLKEATESDFEKFMSGLETVVAKPTDEACGRGVKKSPLRTTQTSASAISTDSSFMNARKTLMPSSRREKRRFTRT